MGRAIAKPITTSVSLMGFASRFTSHCVLPIYRVPRTFGWASSEPQHIPRALLGFVITHPNLQNHITTYSAITSKAQQPRRLGCRLFGNPTQPRTIIITTVICSSCLLGCKKPQPNLHKAGYFFAITNKPATINAAPKATCKVIASLSINHANTIAIITLPLSISATVATSPVFIKHPR